MTFNPQPKIEPYRDQKYLAYIRKCGCMFSGLPAEAHHVRRSYWGAGTGIKPHDYVTLPLARVFHKPESEKEIDVENAIIRHLVGYSKRYCDKRELIDVLMKFIDDNR